MVNLIFYSVNGAFIEGIEAAHACQRKGRVRCIDGQDGRKQATGWCVHGEVLGESYRSPNLVSHLAEQLIFSNVQTDDCSS
jgi:hypothetical protein